MANRCGQVTIGPGAVVRAEPCTGLPSAVPVAVVERWPDLSDAMKAGILAMVTGGLADEPGLDPSDSQPVEVLF